MIKKPKKQSRKQAYYSSFEDTPIQSNLFDTKHSRSESLFPCKIYRDPSSIIAFINSIPDKNYFGIDFEFNELKVPYIVGISHKDITYGVYWSKTIGNSLLRTIRDKNCRPIAFSTISADKEVFEKGMGISTPLSWWEDAIYTHYLCNADLTQTDGQKETTIESLGLMNLWIASLMAELNIPNWKECDGLCNGLICPEHDKLGYCAVDAWVGEQVFHRNREKMNKLGTGIKWDLYESLMKENEFFNRLSKRGVYVDRESIIKVEANIDKQKDELFPYHIFNNKPFYTIYNPNSPSATIQWYEERGLKLYSTDIKIIESELRKQLKKIDISLDQVYDCYTEIEDETIRQLSCHWMYKRAGKGLTSWFSNEYVSDSGLIHSRFNNIGTCNPRISGSKPNLTNIPKAGFGKEVRKLIIPRHKSLGLIKADYKQGELRRRVHRVGGLLRYKDAFSEIVDRSKGGFKQSAYSMQRDERYAVKQTGHAGAYGEGIQLLTESDIGRRWKEISEGALIVMPEKWCYKDKRICFSGVNMALRLFKSKSYEARAKANELSKIYFDALPEERQFQLEVIKEINKHDYIQSITSRYLKLNETEERNIKKALSFIGSGEFAEYAIEGCLYLDREIDEGNWWPILFVHDEYVFEYKLGTLEKTAKEIKEIMESPKKRIPGFSCPVDIMYGSNWYEKDMQVMELD